MLMWYVYVPWTLLCHCLAMYTQGLLTCLLPAAKALCCASVVPQAQHLPRAVHHGAPLRCCGLQNPPPASVPPPAASVQATPPGLNRAQMEAAMRALSNFPGLPLRPEMLVQAMANKGPPRIVSGHVPSPRAPAVISSHVRCSPTHKMHQRHSSHCEGFHCWCNRLARASING